MGAGSGSYGAKLGNNLAGAESEITSYTFTLTPNFTFLYALVLEYGHSLPADNAFFTYWISLSSSLPVSTMGGNLLAMEEFRPDGSSFYTPAPGTGSVYVPWSKECVMSKFPSLSAFVGSVVTIYFATSDCPYSGHYGYAYVDELCKTTPISFIAPSSIGHIAGYPLTVDATATAALGATEYYYTAEECTSTGAVIPSGLSATTSVMFGPPGVADIRPWFPPGFFVMTTYFRITLHAKMGCSYEETYRIVYVN
jgi:hypothetical protein